jgi:Zn-dependent protease with chaperone function
MTNTAWLIQRVVLAILLMVGFYVLAVAVIGSLLWIPYAEYTYLHRLDLRIGLGCIGSAIALALSLVPRRDHFIPPGPLLDEGAEPRLFSFVREVAAATGQAMPSEIYVVGDVNAWVAQRGGTMGFGGRRVMGIGLPLLQAMPLPEVKAVVAHEFGHYASSDVMLSPWTYVTRSAIGRTVAGLDDSFISRPFVWYGRMFMRLTASVSRRQEFVADQVSAQLVGAEMAARALHRVSTISPAFAAYAQTELAPLLRAGFLPPIHEGFQYFLRTDRCRQLTAEALRERDEQREADAADTHPPLRERLAALGAGDIAAVPMTAEPATSLLSDPDHYARLLLVDAYGPTAVDNLKRIRWEHVAGSLLVAQWHAFAAAHRQWLAPLTLATIPRGREAVVKFASPMKIPGGIENSRRVAFAQALLGAALATRMIDLGWVAETMPGESVTLKKDARAFEPFVAIDGLVAGTIDEAEWRSQCEALGLSGPLLPAALLEGVDPAAPIPDARQADDTAARRRRRSW